MYNNNNNPISDGISSRRVSAVEEQRWKRMRYEVKSGRLPGSWKATALMILFLIIVIGAILLVGCTR